MAGMAVCKKAALLWPHLKHEHHGKLLRIYCWQCCVLCKRLALCEYADGVSHTWQSKGCPQVPGSCRWACWSMASRLQLPLGQRRPAPSFWLPAGPGTLSERGRQACAFQGAHLSLLPATYLARQTIAACYQHLGGRQPAGCNSHGQAMTSTASTLCCVLRMIWTCCCHHQHDHGSCTCP